MDHRAKGLSRHVGRGLDSYLQWFHETSVLLHPLLSESGAIYVHLDDHVVHSAKIVLDEVFGSDRFQSAIVWKRSSAHNAARRYGPVHDTMLFYTKSHEYTWNPIFQPLPQETADAWYKNVEEGTGRRFNRIHPTVTIWLG